VTPDSALARHVVFERSIFHDCDIDSDASGTKVVLNTTPVTRYAVVPLEQPSRLLVTFTPQGVLTPTNSTSGLTCFRARHDPLSIRPRTDATAPP